MISLFYVASGGAIGAVSRYGISIFFKYYYPDYPLGTLLINFIGSLLIGILAANLENQQTFIKFFLIIGVLGSFTTFSAFSLEVIQLFNDKKIFFSISYVFLSFFLCIFGAYIGFFLNRI